MKTYRVPWSLVLAGLLAVPSGDVRSQEVTPHWTPAEKARIGVLLEEVCVAGRCGDGPPRVTSVVVDGPADRAGIASGDTLLSIDGLPVTSPEGREALLSLEAGVTVALEVGRNSGRITIEVTPEMRAAEPYVDVRTMYFGPTPETPDAEAGTVDIRVVRVPSVQSRLEDVEVRLDSLRSRSNSFVFFHEDSVGQFRVEIGDPERAEVLLRRLREDGPSADTRIETDEAGVERRLAVTLGGVRAEIPGYVWEHAELADRLVKVRDSALRTARVHLDSLVRLQHRVRVAHGDSLDLAFSGTVEVDPEGNWAYFVGPRRVSGQFRSLFLTDLRVAGAEFRELHGDLAEYFEGTDAGLLVIRVIPGTPAARAGLREGDVVVEVNGEECHEISTLRSAMAGVAPSGELSVAWIRKGSRHTGHLDIN